MYQLMAASKFPEMNANNTDFLTLQQTYRVRISSGGVLESIYIFQSSE